MKQVKLHNVCSSTDSLGPQLECIAIIGEYIYATNCHLLVRLHHNSIDCGFEPSDTKRLIHKSDWYFLIQCESVHFGVDQIKFVRKSWNEGSLQYSRIDNYPEPEVPIKSALEGIKESNTSTVTLNMRQLSLVKNSFTFESQEKVIDFMLSSKKSGAVVMKPKEDSVDNQLAILMPVNL